MSSLRKGCPDCPLGHVEGNALAMTQKVKTKIMVPERHDSCFEKPDPYAADLVKVLMHLAHNTLCTARPFSMTSVFCRFGLNLRFVAR